MKIGVLISFLLLSNLAFGQLDHFLIGIYSYDYDYVNNSNFSAGTDPVIGNDAAFYKLFKDYNFNCVQIDYQLMQDFKYLGVPHYATSNPSKAFLERADSLDMNIILSCPDIYVDRRDSNYIDNPLYTQYDSLLCLSGLNYYSDCPAVIGFSISDEPQRMHFHDLSSYCRQVEKYNPAFLRCVNIGPSYQAGIEQDTVAYSDFLDELIDSIRPNILSVDIYPIYSYYSSHTDTTDGLWPRDFFLTLDIIARKSANINVPLIYVPTFLKGSIGSAIVKNTNELRYVTNAALLYGIKGLNYWHAGDNTGTWVILDSQTKENIAKFNKKIIQHENVLLSLRFNRAYHFSNISTLVSSWTDLILSDSRFDAFQNDHYRQIIFDDVSPIIPMPHSSTDSLIVSFLNDDIEGVYFWVFNKSLVSTENIQLNLKQNCSIIEVLEDQKCPVNNLVQISLLPGEAKLFRTFFNDSSSVIKNLTKWNQKRTFGQDIIIDSLAELIISDSLFLTSSARIIVRSGGKLVVDGGVLTSACDGEMWQGIFVEGDRTRPQTAANQGTVELKNGAVIENAHCGITTSSPDEQWLSTGGIILAEDATFRNNAKSVEFLSYAAQAPAGLRDNLSRFSRCTFTVDDNNLFAANGTSFSSHVTLWDVKGVSFDGCAFANVGSDPLPERGRGIYSEDAGFKVDTYCPAGHANQCLCDESYAAYSGFSGFETAVEALTTGNQYLVRLNQAVFSNNGTGVRNTGNDNLEVTRCQFDMDDLPHPPTGIRTAVTGLSLNSCTGFTVEENEFLRMSYLSQPTCNGISAVNTGRSDNSIYRNTFANLSRGVSVAGGNGTASGGLRITCNAFSGNQYDVYVPSGGTIAGQQGSPSCGADNTFAGTRSSSLYKPDNISSVSYYYSGGAGHAPISPSSAITLFGVLHGNSCQSTLCDLQPQAGMSRSGASASGRASVSASGDVLSAIHAVLSDSVLRLSDLEPLYAGEGSLSSQYALAETQFQSGSDNGAVLQGIDETSISEAQDRYEYENYLLFEELKESVASRGSAAQHQEWPSADAEQIEELLRIAEANTGRSSAMARGVLCFFFGICEEPDEMDGNGGSRGLRNLLRESESESDESISVIPNPTDGQLEVAIQSGESSIILMEIYDAYGRMLFAQQGKESWEQIDLSHLDSGVYLLKVNLDNGAVISKKVVKK